MYVVRRQERTIAEWELSIRIRMNWSTSSCISRWPAAAPLLLVIMKQCTPCSTFVVLEFLLWGLLKHLDVTISNLKVFKEFPESFVSYEVWILVMK